jgi:hypothetical protein
VNGGDLQQIYDFEKNVMIKGYRLLAKSLGGVGAADEFDQFVISTSLIFTSKSGLVVPINVFYRAHRK